MIDWPGNVHPSYQELVQKSPDVTKVTRWLCQKGDLISASKNKSTHTYTKCNKLFILRLAETNV